MKPANALLCALLCISAPVAADIINVPADQPTIQAGIDAAQEGDEVVVADGIWTGDGNRDIHFNPWAISVRSANGPENCIIDCQGSSSSPHQAFIFDLGVTDNPFVIEGFTITNGYTIYSGGAISCASNPGPIIRGNIITGNYAERNGGGVYVHPNARDIVIVDNLISNNTAEAEDCVYFLCGGGGIYGSFRGACQVTGNSFTGNVSLLNGGALYLADFERHHPIADNVFDGNEAGDKGGAIYASDGASLAHNLISGNRAETAGGGVWAYELYDLTDNTFIDNVADEYGGGIHLTWATSMSGNEFSGNHAGHYGGGLNMHGVVNRGVCNNRFTDNSAGLQGGGCMVRYRQGPREFVNNLFAGNQAGTGGGVCVQNSDPVTFRNCTFVVNHAPVDGGGICCMEYGAAVVSNSIVAFNTAGQGGQNIHIADTLAPSTLTVNHTDVLGGYGTIFVGGGDCELITGEGVFSADPLFVPEWDGSYLLSQVAAGEAEDSPCIDAGDDLAANLYFIDQAWPVLFDRCTTRSDGVSDEGTVDLGYHEVALGTASAALSCIPGTGTLPFASQITVDVRNNINDRPRRFHFQINVTLPGGQYFPSWRRGWSNVTAGDALNQSWWQNIPALATIYGTSIFLLRVTDVTPAPYNQPPNPPAGDTDTAVCTVTGY